MFATKSLVEMPSGRSLPFGFGMKSPFEGLWLCGASILGHGVHGAALSGVQCAAKVLEWGGVTLDPLFGGIPRKTAWESLELFHDEVLPRVADAA